MREPVVITGALYPEVAAILDAPDRIRREAVELMKAGTFRRSMMKSAVIFEVDRPATCDRPATTIDIELPYERQSAISEEKLRVDVFEKLIEILEAEERRSASL